MTGFLASPVIRTRGLLRCAGCGLPCAECLCAELPTIEVRTRVIVIAHHVELKKSTNSGRLAARILTGAELRVRGEIESAPRPPLPEGKRLILFPAPGARALSPDDARGEPIVLLVPDGNWKQAKSAFRRDPDTRGAEPVTLPPGPRSRYGLRRPTRDEALSTFEAIARALGLLESPDVERQMMSVFDTFVARSMRVRQQGSALATPPRRRPRTPRIEG